MHFDTHRLALVALVAALVALLLARAVARAWRRIRARSRMRRARRGEARAEKLLRRRGYAIAGRQVEARMTFLVDGSRCAADLRADLIVRRKGRCYVAEVKTGREAPRLRNRATRRQLLEYFVAFDVDGVLLVDAERDIVHEIVFPL